ncbi:MAG: pirin family protein [Alphaproteobacteria bacterium]|nr:pirin family protein [Alphaproteobacteria bacterium]
MSTLIEQHLRPRERDLGGFSVRRILPYAGGRGVGPFVFFDHIGPARFPAGHGVDVRPHPHIGLATVTYLFEGEIVHRDSLGFIQPIRPGDVNWMVAGRGIAHSERTAPEEKARGPRLHGIQAWLALPLAEEERTPGFWHHPAASLPEIATDGARLTLIAGAFAGQQSPVRTFSPTFYLEAHFDAGGRVELPVALGQRAVHVVDGALSLGGVEIVAGEMAVLAEGADAAVVATAACRAMLLGGAALEGPRYIWWNFVSSSEARIERAKDDWKQGRFASVPDDNEFIPLPEN